jgi:nucleoid-associated protein YgaU
MINRTRRTIPAYIVEEGDTLSDIADRELGNIGAARALANMNKLYDPDLIRPGDLLIMPSTWSPQ